MRNSRGEIESKDKTQQDVVQIYTAKKHTERCPNSLVVRELEIKVTVRFHFVPISLAKAKNTTNTYCWRGCGEIDS